MDKKIVFIIGLVIALLLSYRYLYLKKLGYEHYPSTTDIVDERDYAYAGLTFRNTGIPTGWSTQGVYKQIADKKTHASILFDGQSLTANNQKPSLSNLKLFNYPVTWVTDINSGKGIETIVLVQPFIDHPILGSAVFSLGSNTQSTFSSLDPKNYRLPAIYLSLLTGLLLFILCFLLYQNIFISLFSLAIYSLFPSFILSARYALLENLLVPLSLISLIGLALPKKNNLGLLLSAVATGLALATKESGIAVLITGLIILIVHKRSFKQIAIYSLISLILGLSWYVYAFYLSPAVFPSLFLSQTARGFFGSFNFFTMVAHLNFHGLPFDASWLWGWICLALLGHKYKKHKELFIGLGSTLLVFLIFAGNNYPWYSLPFVPFLIIASAVILWEILTDPDPIKLFTFFAFPLSTVYYWGYTVFKSTAQVITIYRSLIIIFTCAVLFLALRKHLTNRIPQLTPILPVIWVIFMIGLLYQTDRWAYQGFQYIIDHRNNLPEQFVTNTPY